MLSKSYHILIWAYLHGTTLSHATSLRHELFRVNQTYNSLTTLKSCRRPVVSLSHATKSCRINRPFENEANLFLLVCRIKGAAGKYPFRKEYGFSRESITQITHQGFRYDQLLPLKMQSSLVPYCFRGKSAFFYNNMVAMVTIETPGFKPKR